MEAVRYVRFSQYCNLRICWGKISGSTSGSENSALSVDAVIFGPKFRNVKSVLERKKQHLAYENFVFIGNISKI